MGIVWPPSFNLTWSGSQQNTTNSSFGMVMDNTGKTYHWRTGPQAPASCSRIDLVKKRLVLRKFAENQMARHFMYTYWIHRCLQIGAASRVVPCSRPFRACLDLCAGTLALQFRSNAIHSAHRGFYAAYTVWSAPTCSRSTILDHTATISSVTHWLSSDYDRWSVQVGSGDPLPAPPVGPPETWLPGYGPNAICQWLVLVPAKSTIDVQLVYMDTEKTEQKQDVLAVYASGNLTGVPDKVWAGQPASEAITLVPAVGNQGYGKLLVFCPVFSCRLKKRKPCHYHHCA